MTDSNNLWRKAVNNELSDLGSRRWALDSFLKSSEFKTLDLVTQTLLETQYHIMNSYSNILRARLKHNGGE